MIPPRAALTRVSPVAHGGGLTDRPPGSDGHPQTMLDFSVNTSPFGPSPAATSAVRAAPLDRYPQPGSPTLRALLSATCAVPEEHVLVTAGTTESLHLIATAYLEPGRHALVLAPTYGEYERVALLAGAHVTTWWADESDDFRHHLLTRLPALRALAPDVVFLCVPNNPTGALISRSTVDAVADALPDTLWVIDEAYMPFTGAHAWSSEPLLALANILLCRSLTKDYALAGVRVGYILGAPAPIAALRTVQPPWTVSTVAEAAACAAIHDKQHLEASLQAVDSLRGYLWDGLRLLGFPLITGETHFCLARVGDATAWRHALLEHGISVRDCTSFGLPAYIRVAPRDRAGCDILLAALAQVLLQFSACSP